MGRSTFDDGGRHINLDLVAGAKDVPGHPDALVVHKYDARVQQAPGALFGNVETMGEKLNQLFIPLAGVDDVRLLWHAATIRNTGPTRHLE